MRRVWLFRSPWNQGYPLSSGFNFVPFSFGFFRFAGGGFGFQLYVLSAMVSVQFWPKNVDPTINMAAQQRAI